MIDFLARYGDQRATHKRHLPAGAGDARWCLICHSEWPCEIVRWVDAATG